MESAIPSHLRCPRTRTARASEDYTPPYPAWTARFAPDVQQVAMLYIGAQYRDDAGRQAAQAGMTQLRAWAGAAGSTALADAPGHHDTAHGVDAAGYDTLVWVGYWTDLDAFRRWSAAAALSHWWRSDARLHEACGWFREVACPGIERFETLFSTPDRLEGAGVLGEISGEIQEHAYWGGMRDRLPIAQTDALRGEPPAPAPPATGPALGARVRVPGTHNLALIRSGQDWSTTQGEERRIYLSDVEPVFREGMDFLRDQGSAIGCIVNRYLQLVGPDFAPLESSYGLSWWTSLEQMERWSESHPTHVAIFGTFMRMVQAMNFDLKLRLYHEVAVLPAADQQFEYLNCHPLTGLLRGAPAPLNRHTVE